MVSSKENNLYQVDYCLSYILYPLKVDGEFSWDEAVQKMADCFNEKDVTLVSFRNVRTGECSRPLEFSDLFEPRCLILESGNCRFCEKECQGCMKRGYPAHALRKNLKPSMFKSVSI